MPPACTTRPPGQLSAQSILARIREEVLSCGGQLRGAGVVSGCLVDERSAPWVFTEANGWTLRLILDTDLDPKGMRVQIAVQRSTGAPLLPLFWFHLDGDPEAHCWRTLPVFVRAISEREFEREDA